jgi:putative redox protein
MSEMDRITFDGAHGHALAARLDVPAGPVRAYALFAHCFTCSKDIFAASRIAGALAMRGFAVLRFDFTGLGASQGEFANTNFSSNVADLVCAANHMRKHYTAPALLVGHSLGGAAVLAAAHRIAEVKAVATIGAPADAAHVAHNFCATDIDRIKEHGKAEVSLGGRTFTIQRQFLDDIADQEIDACIAGLDRALIVFHSPVDQIVGIENAAHIYTAAKHPKSFVSLDDADHLLTRRADAVYVADVLAAWAGRYVGPQTEEDGVADAGSDAVVTETGAGKFQNAVSVGGFRLIADEPTAAGGLDTGPTPYDFLKVGLGACTSMTMRLYADRKEIPARSFKVRVSHDKEHAADCEECVERGLQGKVDTFTREITIAGEVSAEDTARLLAIADKCPVHRTLESQAVIRTRLAQE